MSKYIYRYVIKAILFAGLLAISAYSANMNKEKTKEVAQQLQGVISAKNANLKALNFSKSDFSKEIQKASNNSLVKYGSTKYADIKKMIQKNDTNTSKNTIFYFYSENMPFSTIKNLIPQIKRFKEIKPNSQFFIVFNGFPKKSFFKKLRKLYSDSIKNILTVKVHPFIYKYYKLKMVPAYAYIKCGIGNKFRFNQCLKDDSLLVRGDISLNGFWEILSNHNKKYLKTYNKMIEAK